MSENKLSLSRSELYTPLSKILDPKRYEKTDTNKLCDLLENISKKYYEHTPSKILTRRTINNKLIQRSLTLIKGGINNSLAKKEKKRKAEYTISNKVRKKKVLEKPKKLPRNEETDKMLQTWNGMWNEYAKAITSKSVDAKDISSAFADAELGGAHVHIISCTTNPNYKGKNGIVVEETKNTWSIAIFGYRPNSEFVHIERVPKVHTALTFRITIGTEEKCILINGASLNNYK